MSIARYYDEGKNEEGRYIVGVPMRDIEQDEWEQLPAHLQRSVDAADFYRKTKPKAEPKEGD
jgi:hypothetical protein